MPTLPTSEEEQQVRAAAMAVAAAISHRDTAALERLLAPGFLHRSPGGESRDSGTFLAGIKQIPGEILFIALEALQIDLRGAGALVTGVQHARVRVDGQEIDDHRPFVDWFVKEAGGWRLQVAVDFAP